MNDSWRGLTTQVEPHDHGLATGPWWNVEDWQPDPEAAAKTMRTPGT